MADVDMFTTPFQLTKSIHRDLYPAVDPSNPALSAKGKVVIIAGAGGGLGAAIARAWAQAGAAGIVLIGRTAETLNLTANNISKINESIPIIAEPTHITNESSVKSLFAKVKSRFGKAHVLINTAATGTQGSIGDVPVGSWWSDYHLTKGESIGSTNVKGPFITIQSFIQSFGEEGTVFNLVSLAAALPGPGSSSYASTKLALINIGQNLNLEYPNIRVFSVHPGIVAADDRGTIIDAFTPFAKDKQALTGGVSLWLDTDKAEFLRGGFVSVNWDVNEMEAHAAEIKEGTLNQLGFLNAKLGPEGHPWRFK